MFEKYKEAVLAFYDLKKEEGTLSDNLARPGRLRLKRECLKVFTERYAEKDDKMLKSFFNPLSRYNDHEQSIERFEVDRFRPLVGFLLRRQGIRDEEPIKLLAWLIDFESYQDWRVKKETGQLEKPPNSGKVPGPIDTGGRKISPDSMRSGMLKVLKDILGINNKRPVSIKNMLIIYTGLVLIGTCAFFLLGESKVDAGRKPLANEKCMYWTGDRYEPVKCDTNIQGTALIPINIKTLKHLRRINLPDTLTRYSIGKVWYLGRGDKHDFFTDSGTYPVDTLRRLRPLSAYILKHHISYYKYLSIRVMWSVFAVIAVLLCMICVIYFLRQQKKLKPLISQSVFDDVLQRFFYKYKILIKSNPKT